MAKTLDEKTAGNIRFYWTEIASGGFDQQTLASLLIAMREETPKGSPSREIGDFLAHPRKDRGHIADQFETLRFLVNGMEAPKVEIGAGSRIAIFMPTPFKSTSFTEDLRRNMKSFGLFSDGEIDQVIDAKVDELILCYLGILHFATITVKGKPTMILKVAWCQGVLGIDKSLSLRGYKDGSNFLVAPTNLSPIRSCDFNAFELEKTPSVRAIRGSDGLKLRKF